MRKSWLKAAILAAALLLCFTGCGQNAPISAGQPPESSFIPALESETVEGTEQEKPPDNISVEDGG